MTTEVTAAGWRSPSAGSGSQIDPTLMNPDTPEWKRKGQDEGKESHMRGKSRTVVIFNSRMFAFLQLKENFSIFQPGPKLKPS